MDLYERHVFEAILARRSVRRFVEGRQVERQKIVRLLEAAMAAPSACNVQPWEFVVVTAPETVREVKASIERFGDYNAPLLVVVCAHLPLIPWAGYNGAMDCSAAIENMLLAATAMGLGSVWVGAFRPEAVRRILDIPEHVVPLGIVYLGYPAEQPPPRTQYLEEAVHWGTYDRERPHPPRPGRIL